MRKYISEFLGTFMLVGIGTGTIVYSAAGTKSTLTICSEVNKLDYFYSVT